MKVNTTRSHAEAAMRRNGQKGNRPEEKLAYQIILHHLKKLKEIDNQKTVWFNDRNYAILDIEFIVGYGQKYALRLHGHIHDPKKRTRHDNLQFYFLQEKGYIVIDFWYNKMPYLFLRNQRKLDRFELEEAYNEIHKKLKEFGLSLKPFDQDLDLQA